MEGSSAGTQRGAEGRTKFINVLINLFRIKILLVLLRLLRDHDLLDGGDEDPLLPHLTEEEVEDKLHN